MKGAKIIVLALGFLLIGLAFGHILGLRFEAQFPEGVAPDPTMNPNSMTGQPAYPIAFAFALLGSAVMTIVFALGWYLYAWLKSPAVRDTATIVVYSSLLSGAILSAFAYAAVT